SLIRMARFIAPGGALFIVLADETVGYTGHALRAFIDAGGETGANAHHLAAIAERHRLLAEPREGGGAVLECLRRALPGGEHKLTVVRQSTRLYGHTLADVLALSAITVLSSVGGTEKFAIVRRL